MQSCLLLMTVFTHEGVMRTECNAVRDRVSWFSFFRFLSSYLFFLLCLSLSLSLLFYPVSYPFSHFFPSLAVSSPSPFSVPLSFLSFPILPIPFTFISHFFYFLPSSPTPLPISSSSSPPPSPNPIHLPRTLVHTCKASGRTLAGYSLDEKTDAYLYFAF